MYAPTPLFELNESRVLQGVSEKLNATVIKESL